MRVSPLLRLMQVDVDRWLNRLGNVAFVVVALVAVATAYARNVPRKITPSAPAYQAGDEIDVRKVGLAGSGLILVTRSTCQACASSVDFYRSLAGVPLVAVAAEPVELNSAYLTKAGVTLARTISLPDSGLQVPLLPTLIAVGGNGRVIKAWTGRLTTEQQSEVASLLKGGLQ